MKRHKIGISYSGLVMLALLGVPEGLMAQDNIVPSTQPVVPAKGAATTGSQSDQDSHWPPTRQEWEAFQKQQKAMQEEIEELKGQRSGVAVVPSQTQPGYPSQASATGTFAPPPGGGGGEPIPGSGLADNNVDEMIKSLFTQRTAQQYFSPFDIMNPEHMRPDMPLQIGRWQDLRLSIGLHTVGRFQAIQQSNVSLKGVPQQNLNPGIQDPFANLAFLASIPGKLDVYADLYIASRPHPNTMYAHEGYMIFKDLPGPLDIGPVNDVFQYINVKVGGFDIDFGDGNYHRSNNAFVERNPLIGNPLVDPNEEEIGAEVYSIKGPIYWLVGAGGGTTTEHFDYGSGASGHLKIWGYPLKELRTSASFYYADLSGTNAANENSDLFAASRSGGTYSAVFGGGDSPGQILPLSGKRIMAAQGDVTWNHWPWEMYANAGWTEDFDTNGPAAGSPAETWLYGTIGPVYHITPALYVAARYSLALARSVQGIDSNGWVDRAQVGAGYWLTQNILAKAEYVYEQYHGFSGADGVVSGVDASKSPQFNGLLFEVSFGF